MNDSPLFIIMAQMITRPFFTLLVVGVTVLLTAGMMLHIAERSVGGELLIYDGPWYIAITQLTVGYGDFFLVTDFGRFIAIGPGILGVCTLSLVVTCSFHELQLSRQEKRLAEELYHTDQTQNKLRALVVTFVQRWWRLRLARKHRELDRLQKVNQYELIRAAFRAKFALVLSGTTPELETQIKTFRENTKKVFKTTMKRMKSLPKFKNFAGDFATHKFDLVSKILSCKRAYIRLSNVINSKMRMRSYMTVRRTKMLSRRTIVSKKSSDIALRRMKERISTGIGSTDPLFIDEQPQSPLFTERREESLSRKTSSLG